MGDRRPAPTSEALGPAAVTAALRGVLRTALAAEDVEVLVRGSEVSTLPPDRIEAEGGGAGLNLFCYRVVPRMDARPIPSSPDGVPDPDMALDLHYLLSAHGHEDLAAELLLGVGIRALWDAAALDPGRFSPEELGAGRLNGPLGRALAGLERIPVIPEPLPVEDMSRLWSSLGTPYRPSLTFRVSLRS
jgi:hypothetical protein